MSIEERKQKLHSYIDMIDDEEEREMLTETVAACATHQPDILDSLTTEQLNELEESIIQADTGNLIPHEEVMKMSKEWRLKLCGHQ